MISTPPEDFLFDVGDGTLRMLKDQNYHFERLHGIFFTHGHYDHMGGLWGLLGYLRFLRRKADLPLYFPGGALEIQEIADLYRRLYSKSSPYSLVSKELEEEKTVKLSTFQVRPFAARHRGSISGKNEMIPCFGYTLTAAQIKVVISGDTGPTRKLMEEVREADFAIIEATFADDDVLAPDTHLSISQAAKIGKMAKEFCLVHLTERSYPQALKEGLTPK
jgi:ribonuclease BN (tRNA processing enzyme)